MTYGARAVMFMVIASLVRITAAAQESCPPTPGSYRQHAFGDTRFAVEEGCRSTFTQNEQFFLAGVAQALSSACKLPRDRQGRELVQRFVKAASLSLALQMPDTPFREPAAMEVERATAFAAGQSMTEGIRCNGPEAALLSRGIRIYLERTSATSRFLAGCVEVYAGRYDEKQCQCIARTLRPVVRDIDERFFDRELIKQSIHNSPTVAFPLIFSCGVASY